MNPMKWPLFGRKSRETFVGYLNPEGYDNAARDRPFGIWSGPGNPLPGDRRVVITVLEDGDPAPGEVWLTRDDRTAIITSPPAHLWGHNSACVIVEGDGLTEHMGYWIPIEALRPMPKPTPEKPKKRFRVKLSPDARTMAYEIEADSAEDALAKTVIVEEVES